MFKKLVSHTAIYGLASQVPKIAGIFALYFTSPFLSRTDYAISGIISAVSGAISVFSSLGLNVVLSNMFYKSPQQYKWGWRQIYGFLTLWNIPYSLLLAACLYLIVPSEARENIFLIIALNTIPVVLFGATATLGGLYYQLSQKPAQIAIRSIVIGFIAIGFNIVFIAVYKMGYMGWFWSGAIAQILFQLSYWYPLNVKLRMKPIFNFKWRTIKKNLKISLPTVPHYYSTYLLNFSDRLIMKFVGVPTGNIGLYSAANTVSNPFSVLSIAAGQAVGPMMLQAHKNKNPRQGRNLIFILQILFLCGCFLGAIWVKELYTFLVRNPELHAAYPIGVIFIMSYAYRPMYMGANMSLFFYEKTKKLWRVSFVAGLLNVGLNFLLIPFFGFKIAAFTTFIGFMFIGYSGFFLKDYKHRNTENYYPLYWFIATVLLTTGAFFIVEFNILVKIIISILIVIPAMLSVFKINKKI